MGQQINFNHTKLIEGWCVVIIFKVFDLYDSFLDFFKPRIISGDIVRRVRKQLRKRYKVYLSSLTHIEQNLAKGNPSEESTIIGIRKFEGQLAIKLDSGKELYFESIGHLHHMQVMDAIKLFEVGTREMYMLSHFTTNWLKFRAYDSVFKLRDSNNL